MQSSRKKSQRPSANRWAGRNGLPSGALSAAMLVGMLACGLAHADSVTRTTGYTYEANSLIVSQQTVEPAQPQFQVSTAYTRDAFGNKIQTALSSPATGIAAIPSRAVSSAYQVGAYTTGSTTYNYPAGAFETQTSNALGQSETKVYDPRFGRIAQLTGPNGLVTNWVYDSLGRKVLEQRADGNGTQLSYFYCSGINGGTTACPTVQGVAAAYVVVSTPVAGPISLSALTTGAQNGPVTKVYVDSLEREIRTETQGYDGLGATANPIYVDTQYDVQGRVYQTSRPYYAGAAAIYWTTNTTYDALSRVLTQTNADGSTRSYAYNGLSVSTTHELADISTIVKNSQGQVVAKTDANGKTLNYTYAAFGNLATTVDPLGNTITLTYDSQGNKTAMSDPDLGPWTYQYDALGELVQQTDAKSQVTTLAYDLLGRVTNRTEPTFISNWTFDSCAMGIGKLCQATASNGYSRTHSYDSLGRQSSVNTFVNATNYIVGVTYDSNGRQATQTYPVSGFTIQRAYSPLGYLQSISNSGTGALIWQANTQDAEGHLLQFQHGSGAGAVTTNQTYYASTGRVATIQAGPGNVVQNLSYNYDSAGDLTARSEATPTATISEIFVFDSLHRLTSVSTQGSAISGILAKSVTYDVLGNISSKTNVGTYTNNAGIAGRFLPHAIANILAPNNSSFYYSYDSNGNLINSGPPGVPVLSATYTSFNMPVNIGTPGVIDTFLYGPEHQRVIKQTSGASNVGSGLVIYIHPDNEGGLTFESHMDSTGSWTQENFIEAYGKIVTLVRQNSNGTFQTDNLHTGYQDSVTTITDQTGTVVERLSYDAWGKRRQINGNDDPNAGSYANAIAGVNTTRGFTMQEHLDEIAVIHMNGRIYDPWIGRMMTPDPDVTFPLNLQSLNRYSYVMNNPLKFTDPSGFDDDGGDGTISVGGGDGSGSGGSCCDVTLTGGGSSSGTGNNGNAGNGGTTSTSSSSAAQTGSQSEVPKVNYANGVFSNSLCSDCDSTTEVALAPGNGYMLAALSPGDPLCAGPGSLCGFGGPSGYARGGGAGGEAIRGTGGGRAAYRGGRGEAAEADASGAAEVMGEMRSFSSGAVTSARPPVSADVVKDVTLSRGRFPEASAHIEDAVKAGKPPTLTIDRSSTISNRRASMRGTSRVSGKDRDEYPPAMTKEGGLGASVRPISPTDNRGAGACIGAQCRKLPNGTRINIRITE